MSTTDIHQPADTLRNKRNCTAFKRAMVVSKDEEDYAFRGTACSSQRFQNARVFRDNDKAKQWITST